jgi:hypothetical protein
MQKRTSDYEQRLIRPKAATADMVKRAQPYRADIIQMDAIIKHPTQQFDG